MKHTAFTAFTARYNDYLMQRFHYKTPPAHPNLHKQSLYASCRQFDLYLRFKPVSTQWNNRTIVLARQEFFRHHAKHSTALLHFLVGQAAIFDYDKIGIELASAQSSTWAASQGFDNFRENDWIVDIPPLIAAIER